MAAKYKEFGYTKNSQHISVILQNKTSFQLFKTAVSWACWRKIQLPDIQRMH